MVYSYPVSWRHSSFPFYAAIVGKLQLPQLLFDEKWWHHWARWSILDILWVERIGFQQKRGRKLNSMWPNIKKKTCWRGKINLKIWKWNGWRKKWNTKLFMARVVFLCHVHWHSKNALEARVLEGGRNCYLNYHIVLTRHPVEDMIKSTRVNSHISTREECR